MSTPTPQPPLTPEQRLAVQQRERAQNLLRTAAIGGVIICPLIAVIPPRKLDLYTYALGLGFYLSADHLTTSYTGRSILENLSWKTRHFNEALPTDKAKEFQRLQEEKRGRRDMESVPVEKRGVIQRLWMGDETEGWKERRLQEEREKLARGESYTSIILDQIWEVWNWDKKNKGGEPGEKNGGQKKE